MIIMEKQVKEILDGYAKLWGVPSDIETFSINDKVHTWENFIDDIVNPSLQDLKEIHEKMPMNAHLPIVDANSGTILTQRQALQTVISNALDLISSPHHDSLPLKVSELLEQGVIG